MPKITVELDDDLEERLENAIEEAKDALIWYLDNNHDMPHSLSDFCNDHEIAGSATPCYTRDIETAWFLHANELEEAYENSGLGNNPREGDGTTAIYAYISQGLGEWFYNEAEGIYEDWKESRIKELESDLIEKFPPGTEVFIEGEAVIIDSIEVLDLEEILITAFPFGETETRGFTIYDASDIEKD